MDGAPAGTSALRRTRGAAFYLFERHPGRRAASPLPTRAVGHEADAVRGGGRGGAVGDAELAEDVRHVDADGALAALTRIDWQLKTQYVNNGLVEAAADKRPRRRCTSSAAASGAATAAALAARIWS